MTRAGLKGRCFLELKSVLLEIGYIEKSPKFAYLESKSPHLKIRVKRDRVYIGQSMLMELDMTNGGQFIVKLCLIISCYLSVWSILYFVQLLPSVGHFVNIVLRMQTILLNFIVVYCILIFPFPHVFLILLRGEDDCEVEGFETLFAGIYSLFKLMVNMLDFRQMYGITGKYNRCK